MRDPARIEPMLDAIREAWARDPDLRLCQLIVNLVPRTAPCPEVFSYEDDALMDRLREWLDTPRPRVRGSVK